jgi:hypothetical protein
VVALHRVLAYAVVGVFALGWLWGLVAFGLRRGPGAWFWRWLSLTQILALLEVLVGAALLVLGRRPTTWLHYVYGGGPLAILVIAHALARDPSFESRPWVPFAFAAFVCFGLTLRALMTGLGYS